MDTLVGSRKVTEVTVSDTGAVSVYALSTRQPVAGFQIQNGPILEAGVNGVQVEDLVLVALNRIEKFNTDFPCAENELTIDALKVSLKAMAVRNQDRKDRGVLGVSKL